MKYFLVGYMACGKTRYGREMAERSGMRFIDLDAYIVDRERCTIREIFEMRGEAGFRKMETAYLHEVCELYENFILSVGGGTPCFNDNMEYMNQQGHTIYLNPPVDVLVGRLIRGKHKRPLVSKMSDGEIRDFVTRHLEERKVYYEKARERIEF